MSLKVDLNSDVGEGFGRWDLGCDEALLDIVTSANVACGFHAGDPDVMARTMAAAVARGVGIGAHPGFADLQGFGRRRIQMPDESLANLIRYQVGAAAVMARAAGGALRHVKLHGALANMAAESPDLARLCYLAALSAEPGLVLLVMPLTAMETAAREIGADWAAEIYADRAYADDGTLLPRSQPGAVIHDADAAAEQVATMVRDGAILCASGRRLPCPIRSVCVHGDTPGSLHISRTVRARLEDEGATLARL
ncbi:LamB/YcsF family protein [Tropicimonas sp. IMCC34043]|uniref:LamB/YcsF family protein n=1 Tax=Tropicimonas sp. IMCC34043 TaxID=2248760 RepID=UPI000E2658AB|nr:5-oxoprolinase subunit PxpA [Tropicimonas sp. IMCC34043]